MTLRSRGLARSHDKLNYYISTTIVPLAIKLARMVTYLEGLLFIKSFNALIMWSCKATWKTKIWPDANLTWWARTYKVTLPFDHMVPWGHLTNYSNFISSTSVYGHQTWYEGDLHQVAPSHKVTWLFWPVVLLDHVKN